MIAGLPNARRQRRPGLAGTNGRRKRSRTPSTLKTPQLQTARIDQNVNTVTASITTLAQEEKSRVSTEYMRELRELTGQTKPGLNPRQVYADGFQAGVEWAVAKLFHPATGVNN